MNLFLSVIGPDRPGLVEMLSNTVLFHQANWLDSRMAHLGGQFAGILHIEVADRKAAALESALRSLESEGLLVVVAGRERAEDNFAQEGSLWKFELLGHDRPGILRQVAVAIASLDANVEELETRCESAAMSGERLFRARGQLRLPPQASAEILRLAVARAAAELSVEIDLEQI